VPYLLIKAALFFVAYDFTKGKLSQIYQGKFADSPVAHIFAACIGETVVLKL
jgi:hypothetical protein